MDFLIRYKKIFLICGFLIIILIIGYFLYSFFFKQAIPQKKINTKEKTSTSSNLPTSEEGPGQIIEENIPQNFQNNKNEKIDEKANGGITKTTELTTTKSINATLSENGSSLQYYDKNDGKFYKVNNNGEITEFNNKVFYDVSNITWAPDKEKAILEYPDGSNIVYNFETNKQITLPKHWTDFDFSSQGDQIIMKSMGLDPDNRWLAITNEDGSKTVPLEELGLKDETVFPSWSPNNQIIAMYTEGIDFNRQEVFFVGLNEENFKSTVIEGRGFQPKWSLNGEKLLYSVYSNDNDLKPMLWVVNSVGDSIGSGRKKLNIETWAEKCVFSSTSEIYCAVPKELEKGSGLFPELAKNTSDVLYKINIVSGVKNVVAIPNENFNMTNLIISEDKNNLYFTDEITGKLNKIKLK